MTLTNLPRTLVFGFSWFTVKGTNPEVPHGKESICGKDCCYGCLVFPEWSSSSSIFSGFFDDHSAVLCE